MAYDTRYDPSTDWTLDRIVSWSQFRFRGGTQFGTASQPTLLQVEDFIDGRVFGAAALLARAGYGTAQPVATVGTAVATLLSMGVAYGALIDIELTQPTAGASDSENSRFTFFKDRWDEFRKQFQGSDLEYLGATRDRNASSGLKFTASSWDDQESIIDDLDRKNPLFPRGFLEAERRGDDDDIRAPVVGS